MKTGVRESRGDTYAPFLKIEWGENKKCDRLLESGCRYRLQPPRLQLSSPLTHTWICAYECPGNLHGISVCLYACASTCVCVRHHLCSHLQLCALRAQDPKLSCYQDNPYLPSPPTPPYLVHVHVHTPTHTHPHSQNHLKVWRCVCVCKGTDGLRWIRSGENVSVRARSS